MTEQEVIIRNGITLDPKMDGVTHLNVYTGAHTLVGREISNLYDKAPTDSPRLILVPDPYGEATLKPIGYFKSLEGFWWWLSTGMKDDYFRTCNGFDARKHGCRLPKVTLDSFKHEIRFAIALKLKTYPEMLNRLINSTLPLTHYYVYGKHCPNPKVRPADRSMWVIHFLEEVRRTGGKAIDKILA